MDVLRQTTKSMNDDIADYRRMNAEYQDYIETWIHEIKIPISCINLICENNKGEMASSVKEELSRIDGYVKQALYYARSTNLEKDYMIRKIRLDELIKGTLKKYSKQLISAKATPHFDNLSQIVYGDSKWLEFILGQLIANSIKYKKETLTLTFSACEEQDHVLLYVSDDGIGIPESELPRIFEKGFTGTNGRSYAKSTGVGLYLCRQLCKKDIMVVTETTAESMKALKQILSYISVFVAVVLGFLIVYANNFFIRLRKKELGVYMTLGMSKRNISTILMLETSFIACIALVTGLLLGIFGSQMMSVFTAKIFEADLSAYRFVFAPDAAVKSVIYFGVIFLVVMLLNTIAIGKYKLIDLLYGGRKNEMIRIKNMKTAIKVFVASVLCLAAAYALILNNGIIHVNLYFALSIIFGMVGTLLFFWSLSSILTKIMQRNKRLYFKQLNMFILRQFSCKINTNFVSLSVVCIVLMLVIGIFSTGFSMQNILSTQLRTEIPYEYSAIDYNNGESDTILSRLPSEIKAA